MFSKTCEYALKAVFHVAMNSSKENKIGMKEIAMEADLPMPFLGKILQHLVKHNFLKSAKGPNGGFYIECDVLQLPIIRIVESFDGDSLFRKCGLGLKECSDARPCPIHHQYKPYRDKLKKILSEKSISDIADVIESGKAYISNH